MLCIDYTREVREYLTKRAREKRAKSLTKEIDDVMRSIRRVKRNLATALIREDRDPGLETFNSIEEIHESGVSG